MGAQTEEAARKKVDKHVEPKACFVWHMDSKRGYEPIPGTGCAHWIAHLKGWKGGRPGSNGCAEKYLIRVKDVVKKAGGVVKPEDVKKGNLWFRDDLKHCGIVRKVGKPKAPGGPPVIEIEHCSVRLGRVAKSDWATYFKSGGVFRKG
ncbi:MAG: hypothetical protein ACF8Q5_15210 [Phycisphaerales bacterium JB040]